VQKLSIGHHVFVALDAVSADGTDHFEAVVEAVAATHEIESAGEEAVLERLGAVFACLSGVTEFAVDADGCAETPVAGITVEVGKTASFATVPLINAAGSVEGSASEAEALEYLSCHSFKINDNSY
jgi:hypothetical protein